MLRFINSRDYYLVHYSNLLKKRLLNNESLDNIAEEYMINKLKIEIGGSQCSKIDKMRSEFKENTNMMDQYKTYLDNNKI